MSPGEMSRSGTCSWERLADDTICSERDCFLRKQKPEPRLPEPLTEANVSDALDEVSEGAACMLASSVDCFWHKRMSAEDLVEMFKLVKSQSKTLLELFDKPSRAEDFGEAASADDLAFLMGMSNTGKQDAAHFGGLAPAQERDQDESADYAHLDMSGGKACSPHLRLPASLGRHDVHPAASASQVAKAAAPLAVSPAPKRKLSRQFSGLDFIMEEEAGDLETDGPTEDEDDDVESLISSLKELTSTEHHRPVRGQVNIKSVPAQKGVNVLLCVSRGYLKVQGGEELSQEMLSIPLHHLLIRIVPGYNNMFHVMVDKEGAPDGILIALRDVTTRDKWLATLYSMGINIQDWKPSPTMARQCQIERTLPNGALPLIRWIS